MKNEMEKSLRVGTKIGALAGGILFLIFGLIPSFYIGSFGTVTLMAMLSGGPIHPGLIERSLIVIGTMTVLLVAAGGSIIAGALGGTVLAYVSEGLTSLGRAKGAATEAKTRAK